MGCEMENKEWPVDRTGFDWAIFIVEQISTNEAQEEISHAVLKNASVLTLHYSPTNPSYATRLTVCNKI